jgi:hypothetical protein
MARQSFQAVRRASDFLLSSNSSANSLTKVPSALEVVSEKSVKKASMS